MPEKPVLGEENEVLDLPEALLGSLAAALQDMPVGIAVFDRDLGLRRCNLTWLRFAQRYSPRPELLAPGVPLFDIIPGIEEWALSAMERLKKGEVVSEYGLPIGGTDTSYWDVIVSPLHEGGEVTGFVEVRLDATERVLAYQVLEQRVRERTTELERRREVADGLHEVLAILNSCCPQDQVLDYIITQARRLLGSEAISVYRLETDHGQLRMEEARGIADERVADLLIPLGDFGMVTNTIVERKPLIVPDVTPLETNAFRYMTDPGQRELLRAVFERYRAMLAVPIVVSDRLYGALAIYYPAPREFSAEDVALAADLADHLALAIENAELREQAEASAVLDERNRLARDLHDAVTQTLFSASLIAEVLPRLWQRDADEGVRRLEELRRLTRGALAEMRTLLLELRPTALVNAEFADVLRQLAEAAGTSGVIVDVTVEGSRRLPEEVQVALYRIAQEALNNVSKHSGASRATIDVRFGAEDVEMTITDDGSGFDPAIVEGDHFGLRIMRERAEAVGAGIEFRSGGGTGTAVRVTHPSGNVCGCGKE